VNKLCVVPQEWIRNWLSDGVTIAARPPLPADIEAAVEFAEQLVREGRSGDAGVLARALLKACGRE